MYSTRGAQCTVSRPRSDLYIIKRRRFRDQKRLSTSTGGGVMNFLWRSYEFLKLSPSAIHTN